MSVVSNDYGMRLAVVGCTHGALDRIYKHVAELEAENGYTVDAILCCGDFQAIRNAYDLETMVTPNKYRKMEDFWRYYNGDLVAPKLTIFIGGNHEAVAHNRELYYGGWAAPNIYFMGYSGLINLGGLRIGGFSGIYDQKFFRAGHHELTPYSKNDLFSSMYVRLFELWKLAHLTGNIDAVMSHDWPEYIAYFGSVDTLLRNNPNFKQSLDENTLGCEAYLALMKHLKPVHWFSGHMHTRFTATVSQSTTTLASNNSKPQDLVKMLTETQKVQKTKTEAPRQIPGAVKKSEAKKSAATSSTTVLKAGHATHFLALDKPLPGRSFLEVVHFPFASGESASEPLLDTQGNPIPAGPRISYDLEWLSIIRATHDHFPNHKGGARIPGQIHPNTLAKHRTWIIDNLLGGNEFNAEALEIPRSNFVQSAAVHRDGVDAQPIREGPGVGPQSALFLDWLQLDTSKLAGIDGEPKKANKSKQTAAAPPTSSPSAPLE